jgi:hypothetical protein
MAGSAASKRLIDLAHRLSLSLEILHRARLILNACVFWRLNMALAKA